MYHGIGVAKQYADGVTTTKIWILQESMDAIGEIHCWVQYPTTETIVKKGVGHVKTNFHKMDNGIGYSSQAKTKKCINNISFLMCFIQQFFDA